MHRDELAAHFLGIHIETPKDTPSISDRAIAAMLGVSDKTVTGVRSDMVARSEIPNVETRTDTLGRKAPARKSICTAFIDDTPEGEALS